MKLKKMLISLIGVMAVATITLQSGVYAKKSTTSKKYIGPTILWENSQPKEGYHYGIHSADNNAIDIEIWNLIQYTDSNLNTYANHNFYCLKGRRGLKDEKDGKFYGVYNLLYDDMVADRSQILDDNAILKEINKNTITINGKEINRYNAILAVLDMMYVPAESPEGQTEELLAEKKELIHTLLSKALENELIGNIGQINSGINLMAKAFDFDPVDYEYEVDFIRDPEKYKECNLTEYALTDNDINAIQQAVLWYFTNYYTEIKTGENEIIENPEEKSTAYDKTQDSQNWIYYTQSASGNDWEALQEVNNIQEERPRFARALQAHALYLYMVNEAIENAHLYGDTATINQPPVEVKETELEGEISGNNYIIGPIQIESKNPNKQYEINIDVKNEGNKVSNYKILDSQKKDVQNIKDLIEKGEDIYISIPKDEVSSITIDIDVKYNDKTMKLIASSTNANEQPIAEIEKTDRTISKQLTFVPEEKPFDLALRKYIVKINDEPELSGNDSRVPVIDASKLNAGENPETTAEYKHKKYPVTIKTGDKVTYKMTIYNEGEKAGRATEVVDQLPEGLKFLRVVDGKFKEASYDEETNKLTLIRDNNNDNLNPFTEGAAELASETITIECEVTAEPDTENSKILTNVAWISKSIDEDGKETNDVGDDRDSLPSKSPDVNKGNMEDYKGDDANDADLSRIDYHYKGKQDDDDFEKLVLEAEAPKPFDLALRKYIVKINDEPELSGNDSRVPVIDASKLNAGENPETTAEYKHKKYPVTIKTGDKVTYKMTIYNEGEKAGRATEVVDQLPEGLKFLRVVDGKFKEASYDEETNKLTLIRDNNNDNLNPFTEGAAELASETITIECEVTAEPDTENSKILTNVAWISKSIDEDGKETNNVGDDRDSLPSNHPNVNKGNMGDYKGNDANDADLTKRDYHYKGIQDDDDFEKLILKPEIFDLALRKFITSVNDKTVPERIILNDEDVKDLNSLDENGNVKATTANYHESKDPITVKNGDIVTYTLRVYNEGTLDGYAQKVTEDIPEGLEFIWSEKQGEELEADKTLTDEEKKAIEFNQKYLWGDFEYDESGKIIKTTSDYLSKENETTVGGNLLEAFGWNDGTKTKDDLKYKDIQIKLKVVAQNVTGEAIRNEAAITDDADEEGKPIDPDRDSEPENWNEHPDHQDDEDHDYIILQSFDLALRKFIVAISKDTKIESNEELRNAEGLYTRAPVVDTSKLNMADENGNKITTATYNHTKEPVMVAPNDIVVYMLRVYNEGDMNGYAAEIKDHLPPYLEFVEGEYNKQYGWEVSEDGRTVTTKYLENSLIKKPETDENGTIVLSYQEVPIMCKVSANPKTSENITNIADITKYLDENKQPVTDRDSQPDNVKLPEDKDLPGYKGNETGSYVPGQQDDDDFEKVVVKIFDLALRKWVTQAIVIENGGQTVTQTGHDAWDDPEAVVKVELHRKKLSDVTVKFRYSIRVYNQGEIEGYATEITDYVPEGLKFVAEDNPGWIDEGNNVISTKLLENKLLKPGEYADVEVLLTWINSENNMGVMTNTAEISIDKNEFDLPDIDSTPDNKKPGEDDIDDAPVMLSISTGQARIYFTLGFVILMTGASGIVLIKKFVL